MSNHPAVGSVQMLLIKFSTLALFYLVSDAYGDSCFFVMVSLLFNVLYDVCTSA